MLISSCSLSSSVPRFLVLFLFLCIFQLSSGSTTSKTPAKIGRGYRLISIEESPDGGIVGLLQVIQKNNVYGSDIPLLQLYVKHETKERLRVHITDAEKKRWEVPYDLLPREVIPAFKQTVGGAYKTEYGVGGELIFSYKADPFTFTVRRKSTGDVLFDTTSEDSDPYSDLVFKDQYIEISTKLPKDASLYGLGENTQPKGIKLNPKDPYTLYTTDISAINLNADLYGSHPVYMDLRNRGGGAAAHGVLLLNSNGMDVFYRGDSLTYKVIGGIVDLISSPELRRWRWLITRR